jgi:hypothetical protein
MLSLFILYLGLEISVICGSNGFGYFGCLWKTPGSTFTYYSNGGDKEYTYKLSAQKPYEKQPLGRPRRRSMLRKINRMGVDETGAGSCSVWIFGIRIGICILNLETRPLTLQRSLNTLFQDVTKVFMRVHSRRTAFIFRTKNIITVIYFCTVIEECFIFKIITILQYT